MRSMPNLAQAYPQRNIAAPSDTACLRQEIGTENRPTAGSGDRHRVSGRIAEILPSEAHLVPDVHLHDLVADPGARIGHIDPNRRGFTRADDGPSQAGLAKLELRVAESKAKYVRWRHIIEQISGTGHESLRENQTAEEGQQEPPLRLGWRIPAAFSRHAGRMVACTPVRGIW